MDDERRTRLQKALLEKSNGDYVPYVDASGRRMSSLPLAVPDFALEKLAPWLEGTSDIAAAKDGL